MFNSPTTRKKCPRLSTRYEMGSKFKEALARGAGQRRESRVFCENAAAILIRSAQQIVNLYVL
jgi:hypothetical protein